MIEDGCRVLCTPRLAAVVGRSHLCQSQDDEAELQALADCDGQVSGLTTRYGLQEQTDRTYGQEEHAQTFALRSH